MKTTLRNIALTAVLAASAGIAGAQTGTYPDQSITLVIPFSVGGDADLAARNLAAVAQGRLGQNIVPLNRAGAGGGIGSQMVKNAKADGYTLLLARVGSQVILPALQPSVGYQWKDFTLLGLLELNPYVCVVRAESPYKHLSDLVEAIKAQPGKLNYSTSGPATILNLGPQLLFDVLKLDKNAAVQIVYKGGGDAALAVLSSAVDFSCGNLSSLNGNIKAGKLRALMTTTPERLKEFPDVPTAREAGYPQLESIVGWSALYGPPGLPKAVVDRWAAVLAEVAKDPQWIKATHTGGSIPQILSPSETEKYVAAQVPVYERLGKQLQLGLK
ncbi:MAG: tripartite tricarboxylate transporter substrate binding protein [Pseudomonadota bacterium]|nr:tripartite tricarboxylate transporter substrate binding protein [Pseudomonadota bacterium]